MPLAIQAQLPIAVQQDSNTSLGTQREGAQVDANKIVGKQMTGFDALFSDVFQGPKGAQNGTVGGQNGAIGGQHGAVGGQRGQ